MNRGIAETFNHLLPSRNVRAILRRQTAGKRSQRNQETLAEWQS